MSYGTIAETMDINSGNFKNKNGYVNNKDFLVFPEEEDARDLADCKNFSESEKAQQEWYHILANRLRYTRGYIFFYFFVLILGVIVLGWSLFDFIAVENQRRTGTNDHNEVESKRHPLLLVFDVILVISICIEVLIRYLATSETFFNRCSNFSDVALSCLCVIGLFLDFTVPLKNDNGISFLMFLNTALLCVRGLWVFLRVVKIMMDRRKAQAFAALEENQIIFDDNSQTDLESYRELSR